MKTDKFIQLDSGENRHICRRNTNIKNKGKKKIY